jgi:hypothetical protein
MTVTIQGLKKQALYGNFERFFVYVAQVAKLTADFFLRSKVEVVMLLRGGCHGLC